LDERGKAQNEGESGEKENIANKNYPQDQKVSISKKQEGKIKLERGQLRKLGDLLAKK